jgi:hypothetical protein
MSQNYGWQRNFIPKKFRGIDSEWYPLFRGRKCSLRGIPRFTEESIPKLGTEWKYRKKCVLQKILLQQTELRACFSPQNASERNSELFLFRGKVLIGIPSVCIYFCFTDPNSEWVSLLRNSLERNSVGLLLFLFHITEFRAFFPPAEWFGTEFRKFSVPRNSRNSAGTNLLLRLFRLPRNNFFVGNCQP